MSFLGHHGMGTTATATRATSNPAAWLTLQHATGTNFNPYTERGFMALAELSAGLPRRAGGAIEILLAAARLFDDGFAPLRPLWAREATHRALSTVRLFTALRRRDRESRWLRSTYERRLALHLAAGLASLETTDLTHVAPCSGPLRETARDLVELFGPASGQVVLNTHVEPLSLAGYRRRALVLLGNKLVASALTYAFNGRAIGHLSLRLERVGATYACLTVRDDGVGFPRTHPNPAANVAGSLAELLQGDIRYLDELGGGVAVKITFSLD